MTRALRIYLPPKGLRREGIYELAGDDQAVKEGVSFFFAYFFHFRHGTLSTRVGKLVPKVFEEVSVLV